MTVRAVNNPSPASANPTSQQVNPPSGGSASPANNILRFGTKYKPKTPQEQLDRARQINEGCWSEDGLVPLAGCRHLKLGPTAHLHLGVKEVVQMALDAAEAGDNKHALNILGTGFAGGRFTRETQFVKDNPEKNALIHTLLESLSFHPFVITSGFWDASNFVYNNFVALQQLSYLQTLTVGNDEFTNLQGKPAGKTGHWMSARGVGAEIGQVVTLFDSFVKTVADFDQRVEGILRERQRALYDLGVSFHGAKRLDIDWNSLGISKAEQVQLKDELDQKRPFFMRYEKNNEQGDVAAAKLDLANELLKQLGNIRGPGAGLPGISAVQAAISVKEAGFYTEFDAPANLDLGHSTGSGNARWAAASCLEEASRMAREAVQKGLKITSFWFNDSESLRQLEQQANAVVKSANTKTAQGESLDAAERNKKRSADNTLTAIGELRQTRFHLDSVLQDFGRAMFDFHENAASAMASIAPEDPSQLSTFPHNFREFQRFWRCEPHLKTFTFDEDLLADLGLQEDDRLFRMPAGAPEGLIEAKNRPQPVEIQRMKLKTQLDRENNWTQSQRALAEYYQSGQQGESNIHKGCTVSEVKFKLPEGGLARLRGPQRASTDASLLPVDDALKLANSFSELTALENLSEHLLEKHKKGTETAGQYFVQRLTRIEQDLADKQKEFGNLVRHYFDVSPEVAIRSDMIAFEGAVNASALIAAGQATSVVEGRVFKELQDAYNFGVARFQQLAERTLANTAKPIGYAGSSIAKAASAARP